MLTSRLNLVHLRGSVPARSVSAVERRR